MPEDVKPVQEDKETFVVKDNYGKQYELPKILITDAGEIKLDVLYGHAISKTRKETKDTEYQKFKKIEDEFNSLKNEYEHVSTKLNEVETTGLSEKDKKLKELEGKLAQFEKKQKESEQLAQKNFEQFRNERINSEIYGAFSGVNLQNQEHTARLFRESGKVDVVQDAEGTYKTLIKMNLPNAKGEYEDLEGSPKEVFQKWIALEQNSYLLKNNLQAGGGSSKTGASRSNSGQLQYKRSELANDATRKEYSEKLKQGMDVSIIPD